MFFHLFAVFTSSSLSHPSLDRTRKSKVLWPHTEESIDRRERKLSKIYLAIIFLRRGRREIDRFTFSLQTLWGVDTNRIYILLAEIVNIMKSTTKTEFQSETLRTTSHRTDNSSMTKDRTSSFSYILDIHDELHSRTWSSLRLHSWHD